jgi:hypothetical protein
MSTAAKERPKAKFVDFSARDFKRKFDEHRPQFAVNHDESIRNIIPFRSDNLEADGCAFTCALDWLMTLAGFNEAPRSFVRAVAGAIERDASGTGKRMAITDERLAELMNCTPKTVQRQRKEYLKQEQSINFSIIHVEEGEFDRTQGKHATTLYEFLVGKQAAQTVERARTSPLWKRDQFAAMREAAREVFNDIDDAPLAAKKRKKQTLSPEAEARKIRQTIISLAKRLGDQTRKIKDSAVVQSLHLDELSADIEDALISGDLRQAFVTKGVDPPTGQNVHQPPASQPVLNKEEEVWTASTPPDEPMDDAWASLESRLRREQPIDEPDTDSPEDVDSFADNIFAFPDEPRDELTYELDDNDLDDDDLDDDDLAIIAAERAAIQDEANSLPLEPDELSTSPPTFTASPPLETEDAAYRYFEASIATRADELVRTQGMTARQADRAAWNEHGHFYAWLAKKRTVVAEVQHE